MKDKKLRGESTVEALLEYANSVIATLRDPLLVLDKNLQIISSNQAFYTTFHVEEREIIGRSLPDVGNREWDIPKLLLLLKEIIPENKIVIDYEIEHVFGHIGRRVML
jgi:PAS domain-containing protein